MISLKWSAVATLWLAMALTVAGREPWAEPGLPKTDGLVLWLDAAGQQAAWQARGKSELGSGAAFDVWYDGSGNGLHLRQRLKDAQPRWISASGRAVVRFDGKDDHLALTRVGRKLDAWTVFLVAAPRSNAGFFRAFLSGNEAGKNDYTSGFTIDQSGLSARQFEQLNVEGKGFGGAVNLLRSPLAFGQFHILEVTCQAGKNGVELWVDGQPVGKRPREPGTLALDDLTLGARYYSNSAEPPFVSGFLDGDIAEVLLYDRVPAMDERGAIRAYLAKKHVGLTEAFAATGTGRLRRAVADPPPIQMFVPGFTVKQLPVDLTNINNVLYRSDGKLVALAYDGNIYLLSDTDGDGLEDRAELFWENKGRLQAPIGMALTPLGYKHGNGVFVASKEKVSLLVDTTGNGKADKEIIVAQGWKPGFHAVEALGVALGPDGSVYFGRATANFADAYQRDKQGKAHFDIRKEHGTIQKVAPDFSKHETIATGIRFSVALRFNRLGDLFATDQEGATWLPNGNPLDELLHIQLGRHYGFPPSHPTHLPGLIDEPSVFDYGPQHQSTCGLNFNEPVNGGPVFGPKWWAGDALVCGESRGKIYRTQLAKTSAGYVGQNHVLAALNMLTIDACVSPRGDLVVATHSGPPDWGTGPKGKGTLFKISASDTTLPQPVLAWAAGPREVRVVFDRPLDPAHMKDLAKSVHIEYGPYVSTGDRFEVMRPPYEVVKRQDGTPRQDLAVLSAQVTPDRRTLVLGTAPQLEAVPHALTLPGLGRPALKKAAGQLQHPVIELGYNLGGVLATWQAAQGSAKWQGWLPHLDLGAAQPFTVASADHDTLWQAIRQPGTLTLRTQLDLWNMLRPATQPGATLDYKPKPERVTVTFTSSAPLRRQSARGKATTSTTKNGRHQLRLDVNPKEGELVPVELTMTTGADSVLEVAYTTAEDPRPRALELRRFLVPWATTRPQATEVLTQGMIPELEGGSWVRGRDVFFSDQALCSKCHKVRGQGGNLGPDLANLVHRDYDSVLRDIRTPSAALNPDYIGHSVELKDGRVLTGLVRPGPGETIVIGDSTAKETPVLRAQVASMTPSAISVMPEKLAEALGPDKLRDLLTFLLTEPLQPAPLERTDAPPPRRRAEVQAVRPAGSAPAAGGRKLHIVLAAGPKDHGPDEHDYPLWQRRWVNLLSLADNVKVSQASGWPASAQWQTADVVVFYSANPAWAADKAAVLDAYQQRGGGLVYLHYAVDGRGAVDTLAERIGLAWRGGGSRFRHGPLELTFTDPKHPIARGFDKVRFVDESYWQLAGEPKKIHVLATAVEDGQPRPLLWTYERGKGRVFVNILGHYTWTFDDPLFRILVLRGMAWTAGEPPDRFSDLATVGARIAE